MSNDKGTKPIVNVVKPTSIEGQLSTEQPIDQLQPLTCESKSSADPVTAVKSYLPPDAPAELVAALSKEIEPYDLFVEPFGTINRYGETVLFESTVEFVEIKCTKNGELYIDLVKHGKVTIVFYPQKGDIFLIALKDTDFWPCVKKKLLKSDKIGVRQVNESNHYGSYRVQPVNVIKIQPGYDAVFNSDEDLMKFRRAIRNIQVRISKNRLPTSDLLKDNDNRILSEFWYRSFLRPSYVKVLCIHEGNIWKMESSTTELGCGIVTLVQYKCNQTLRMLINVKDERFDFVITPGFVLQVSDISSDENDYIWEWFIDSNNRSACAFETAKKALDFKTIVDYYMKAREKNTLSWNW